MLRSQQLNLENVKIKVRNFSHIQTPDYILFNYEIILRGAGQGKASQGR